MKRYCIKCRANRIEYFDIISEDEEGFHVRLTRICDGNQKVTQEYMSRSLFNICQKTGYIYELERVA